MPSAFEVGLEPVPFCCRENLKGEEAECFIDSQRNLCVNNDGSGRLSTFLRWQVIHPTT